jgi:hypothetical protein
MLFLSTFTFYKLGRKWQTIVEKYAGKLITAQDLSGKMTQQIKNKISSEISSMSVSKVEALADSVKETLQK